MGLNYYIALITLIGVLFIGTGTASLWQSLEIIVSGYLYWKRFLVCSNLSHLRRPNLPADQSGISNHNLLRCVRLLRSCFRWLLVQLISKIPSFFAYTFLFADVPIKKGCYSSLTASEKIPCDKDSDVSCYKCSVDQCNNQGRIDHKCKSCIATSSNSTCLNAPLSLQDTRCPAPRTQDVYCSTSVLVRIYPIGDFILNNLCLISEWQRNTSGLRFVKSWSPRMYKQSNHLHSVQRLGKRCLQYCRRFSGKSSHLPLLLGRQL